MLQVRDAWIKRHLLAEPGLLTSQSSRVDGSRVATALEGSWRSIPPAHVLTAEGLELLNARLQSTGAGGLAWWRIKGSELAQSPAGASLHDAFRVQTLDALAHKARLRLALEVLEAAGVEPILAKGWGVARLYPQAGLRPYGDLDLFVAAEAAPRAREALADYAARADQLLLVDLHEGPRGHGGSWASVAERSFLAPLGERTVRVFGHEDHLGLLSSHLLSHGAWRPLWLCDIAMMCESLAGDFDWDYVSALPPRQVEEVRVAVRLSHEVLGADIGATPWASADERLPSWLPAATTAAWSHEHYSTTTGFALTEARLGAVVHSLRLRWPNPIEVTSRWGAPYNRMPRLPLQLVDSGARAVGAMLGAPERLSRRRAANRGTHDTG